MTPSDNSDGIERIGPAGVYIGTEGTGTLSSPSVPTMKEFEELGDMTEGALNAIAEAVDQQRKDFQNLEARVAYLEQKIMAMRANIKFLDDMGQRQALIIRYLSGALLACLGVNLLTLLRVTGII